jgi:hypothetical protein
MKKLHPKMVVAGIIVAGLVIVATGMRVRTQTGWRMKIVGEGISETKTRDGVHLSLRLVDTRDQKRHEYDWWFRVDEMRKANANIEVDCGEYKRLLLWKNDTGIAFDGQRFKRTIAFAQEGTGTAGVYQYDFKWQTKGPDQVQPPTRTSDP